MKAIRTFALAGCVGVSALAVFAGSASAAFDGYTIVTDSGSNKSILYYPPANPFPQPTPPIDLGSVYTANGSPVVTDVNGVITFNFNACLSEDFKAMVAGMTVEQSTNGRLVFNISFTEPTSLIVLLSEAGGYTSGNSSFDISNIVSGSVRALEADNPISSEFDSNTLDAVIDGTGSWSATAAAAIAGYYYDYQIIIDNFLFASVIDGPSSIWKDTFSLTFITGVKEPPPIPEPASLSLLGLGAVGLMTRRRK